MREILFRGKRQDNGEWAFGSYAFEPRRKGAFGQIISDLDHERHYIVSKKNYEYWEVIPETVGQYTGLTDKNGTRIFEGDIIAPAVLSNVPPCEVMFDVAEGQFVVKDACGDYHGALANFGRIFDNRYTVVGNKWDNPELLEEGELCERAKKTLIAGCGDLDIFPTA